MYTPRRGQDSFARIHTHVGRWATTVAEVGWIVPIGVSRADGAMSTGTPPVMNGWLLCLEAEIEGQQDCRGYRAADRAELRKRHDGHEDLSRSS
jgi:hypothetical protein